MSRGRKENLITGATGSGWLMLFVLFGDMGAGCVLVAHESGWAFLCLFGFFFLIKGFYALRPQMAAAAAIEGHFVDIREWD